MSLPPLPPGATLLAPEAPRRDPLEVLKAEGFEFTNGFRTPADTQRIREQGYKPATNSAHLDGDGVDLRHPKLSPSQQSARLRELFGDWEGFDVRDEGHHRHLRLPGWGAAPGTPGTPASGLPPLPEGASLYQRGSLDATPPMSELEQRIATLDMGLERGDMTPEQHRQFVAEVKSGRSLTDQPADLVDAGGVILFRDEQPETPATKLSAEDEAAFLEFVRRGDIAGARRFRESKGVFGTDNLDEVVAALKDGARLPDAVNYNLPEAKQSDGAAGAFARGLGDPFNVLDEMGGVVDTLGVTPGRESVFNSERSFVDILNSNTDLNRAVLKADDEQHFKSRLGGQLLTSFALPIGLAARTPAQLAKVGAAEGFAAGFGAGEGNPLQRAPNALLGAGVGAGGGFALGKGIELGAPAAKRLFAAVRPSAREAAFEAAPVVNDAAQNAGPTPAAKTQPQGGVVGAQSGSGPVQSMGLGEKRYFHTSDKGRDGAALVERVPQGFKILRGAVSQTVATGEQLDAYLNRIGAEAFDGTPEAGAQLLREASRRGYVRDRSATSPQSSGPMTDALRARVGEMQAEKAERAAIGPGTSVPPLPQGNVVDLQHRPFKDHTDAQLEAIVNDALADLGIKRLAIREGWARGVDYRYDGPGETGYDPPLPGVNDNLPSQREAAMASGIETPMLSGPDARQRDYINVADLPPLPPGASLIDDAPLGKVRPMGQQASAEEIAAAARGIEPRDVVPIPDNVVRSVDELESSFKELEAPRLGRTPKKPGNVLAHVKDWVRAETNAKGMPVRIDAEDAIDKGVPAEYIYMNPNVADRAKLRLRNPSIFGTRYGAMSGEQQHLRSLDALDLDPVAWGFDNVAAERLEPDDVGDLLRRGFDGDESALNRADPAFGPWSEYQARAADRAEFDGRFPDGPPVERVGVPATMDDLANLEPPVTAYEDLPKVGGKVANINLANVETRQDIRRLLQAAETRFGGFDAARRGKVSQGETAQLASELGMTPDDLLKRRKGQALNAEQALAARQLLAKSGDEVTALAKRMGDGPSDEERAAFARAMIRHAAIQEQVSGATAEAGRALAQFKMAAKSKAVRGRIHDTIIQGMGGAARLEDVADKILELQRLGADPGAVNKFAVDALKPRASDYLVEYYYNALLSGVSTHVVNSASNLATQLMSIPEYAIAAGLGAARSAGAKLAGKQAAERAFFSEAGARAFGLIQGTKDGLKAFAKVMRTGDPTDPMTKVEARRHKAIPGVAGSIIRTPTRLLMAEDELFKATARRSSMAGLAVRKARSEGLKGDAAKRRVAELVANPTDAMVEESFNFARYLTFQTPLLKLGQLGTAATEAAPILKLVFPFIRTPANLFKFAIERTPVAQLAVKRVRADYKAGGVRRDLAIARATFGAGVGAMVMGWAAEGKITGRGPDDPSTRRLLMAGGWQPFSVKIGDKWFSYSRTDPFATLFGVAADLATYDKGLTEKQRQAPYIALFDSVMSQIENKTWLSGLSDLVQAMDDPARFGEGYVSRLAGSLIPTMSAHAASSIDPVMRQTVVDGDYGASVVNRARSRIPGLSSGLPAMRDVWGEPIRREGGPVQNFLSPFYMRTDKGDPVGNALLGAGVGLGKPRREISDGMGGTRELSERDFGRYQELSGRYIREDVRSLISDQEWEAMSPVERKKEIKKVVSAARKAAREELFEGGGEGAASLPPLPPGASLVE